MKGGWHLAGCGSRQRPVEGTALAFSEAVRGPPGCFGRPGEDDMLRKHPPHLTSVTLEEASRARCLSCLVFRGRKDPLQLTEAHEPSMGLRHCSASSHSPCRGPHPSSTFNVHPASTSGCVIVVTRPRGGMHGSLRPLEGGTGRNTEAEGMGSQSPSSGTLHIGWFQWP